ncbi:hypothetical protein MBLNU457_g0749t1 [Dothideomycetes sp. NU457]
MNQLPNLGFPVRDILRKETVTGPAVVKRVEMGPNGRKSLVVEVESSTSKELPLTPNTPSSIAPTPTELYHSSPTAEGTPRNIVRNRAVNTVRRSVYLDRSGKMTVLEEGGGVKDTSSDAKPTIPAEVPTATEIHLPTGRVLRVFPPEATAFERRAYVPGQVRLQKPDTIPHRSSIATLAPFQAAITNTLPQPHPVNDDDVEEICDFVDSFGFDGVKFDEDEFLFKEDDVLPSPSKEFANSPFFLPENYSRADEPVQFEVHDFRGEQASGHKRPSQSGSGLTAMQRLSGGSYGSASQASSSKETDKSDEVEETSTKPSWMMRGRRKKDKSPVPPKEPKAKKEKKQVSPPRNLNPPKTARRAYYQDVPIF